MRLNKKDLTNCSSLFFIIPNCMLEPKKAKYRIKLYEKYSTETFALLAKCFIFDENLD